MRRLLLTLCTLAILPLAVFAQNNSVSEGRFVFEYLNSEALAGNPGGEDPVRRVSIYLPPGYDDNSESYPVIYYLHGITQSDSSLIADFNIEEVLNNAIATGKIRPVIFVMCNQYTLYRGSFYSNSSLTGNWSDFTAKELVGYIDQNYRTISDRESRGIAGHSMGGHGAIKMGMLYPDVFSSLYALSPYLLDLEKDYGIEGDAFRQAQTIKSRDTLITGYTYMNANAVVAAGRAFSPNPDNPSFYADLPYSYQGDSVTVNYHVLDLWNSNLPNKMIDEYSDNLSKLKAIKFDWGWDDFFTHIPTTSKTFSTKLDEYGIDHFAEGYNGSHMEKIYTPDGRLINDVFPFFNTYLSFN